MKKRQCNKQMTVAIILFFIFSASFPALGIHHEINFVKSSTSMNSMNQHIDRETNFLTLQFNFSYPTIHVENESIWIYVNESDLNMMIPGKPVVPVNISTLEFEFGTQINSITYNHSTPILINLTGHLVCASQPTYDYFLSPPEQNSFGYENADSFPADWISYHIGGGLSQGEHTTFLVQRVYPVRYYPDEHQLQFIEHITINISYSEPVEPLLTGNTYYDLLILAPSPFIRYLKPLVRHKHTMGVQTRLVELEEVYDQMFWQGRDKAEKIKYFIKNAVHYWGISHVLLVGGLKGQTLFWKLPVRYSHVVPPDEQEYAEQSFLSDLYFADLFDSTGNFSSWDSNYDNKFSVWNSTFKEEMDLYPDVYLGRLPCRTIREVKIMVHKIIQYEKEKCDDAWFKKLILVAGDSYNDTNQFNEGVLISERAIELMPDFIPVKVYATADQDINRRTVNKALNKGAGFAYFCGHGSPISWATHFPPDGTEWTKGYDNKDMKFVRNRRKLPIAVVGGCHNGQFDVTMWNIVKGIFSDGLKYFSTKPGNIGEFWYNEWVANCWAWKFTSVKSGGTIATIANTGLGTHGDGDIDNNSIADYLEVLDGWLELRFLQLYGEEQKDDLGENHGETLTGYLHRFLGNEEKMDVKMVQQWELFGDPSLKIGGYEN
jgi:hypothetical protein